MILFIHEKCFVDNLGNSYEGEIKAYSIIDSLKTSRKIKLKSLSHKVRPDEARRDATRRGAIRNGKKLKTMLLPVPFHTEGDAIRYKATK